MLAVLDGHDNFTTTKITCCLHQVSELNFFDREKKHLDLKTKKFERKREYLNT